MSSLGSPNPFFIAGKKAYEVERSLRFNKSEYHYLTRTPSSTGNQKVWTFSAWIKRTNLVNNNHYIYSAHSGSDYFSLYFQNDNLYSYYSPGNNYGVISDREFRDVGAWFHLVHQVDAANTTQRVWINGEELTLNSSRNPSNSNFPMNESGVAMVVGTASWWLDNNASDMYLAEVHYSDGYKYTPSDFAETNTITGQWIPKSPSISYGTNGYYLNFSDNSGTTATTLGKDSSGNGNNFTPNNFSVSAGEGNDSLEDSPTNNFPTINPLDGGTNALLTNGNLTFKPNSSNSGNFNVFYSNFSMRSGKWYFEVLIVNENSGTNSIQFGIGSYKYKRDSTNQNGFPGTSGLTFLNVNNSSSTYRIGFVDGSSVGSSVSTASTNDIYGIAFDADNKKVYFYKNGSAEGESSGYNVTDVGTGDFFFFSTLRYSTGGSYQSGEPTLAVNFGQRAFSYTAPTGYKKLNSANLPNPTIKLPNKHFDTFLYTATGNAMSFTGLDFQPDWIWQKSRNSTGSSNVHYTMDAVRGGDKGIVINSTNAEFSGAAITFTSNGYDMGASTGGQGNGSGNSYVSWNWNAGETDGKTYAVKVVSDSGNKYRFDDFGTSAVTLDLAEGGTYIFDQSDSSNAGHPLRFSTTSDGTHGGGSEYTTGVTTAGTPGQSGAYTQIVVAASAPTLYYYCSVHSGMGGQANTNSTLGSSNFDGAIQSTVKVNATAGFSITNFYPTAASTAVTTGHGLGVTPDVVIVKSRGSSANWDVLHMSLGSSYKVYLNGTNAQISSGAWGSTDPTSSVFTYNPGNQNNNNQIAYCFSEVAGYSKFGRYDGNNANNGTFVFTGFRPAWVMIKRYETTRDWIIYDNKRSTFNVIDDFLEPNNSTAEQTASGNSVDFVSNGFKFRNTSGDMNGLGDYIYFAFAESPFKYARAR